MAKKRGSKSSEFIVKINNVNLTSAARARINAEIQAATMRELARVDLSKGLIARIPNRRWLGIWIEPGGGVIPRLRVQKG